jgi:hypothetical protein
MDDNNELSASVVRNLDVIEAATRHLVAVEKRLLGVIMAYLDSECADIGWRLAGRDVGADNSGFDENSFFPSSWTSEDDGEDADFYFEICAEGPACGDLNWITCLTRAMGNDGETVIQANFQNFLGKTKAKKFLIRPDIRNAIAALRFENSGVEIQRRFVIDRELLAKAFDEDDGEELTEEFRAALAPIGQEIRDIVKRFKEWDALRAKAVAFANE